MLKTCFVMKANLSSFFEVRCNGSDLKMPVLCAGIFARWTMVGHHVSHGGYNQQQTGKRFHRSTFAKGFVARAVDWLDWMLPEVSTYSS